MLDTPAIKKINDFVYTKPRTIQEISELIGKNWRTADRYIEQISKEHGTISSRVFRGGTRGALKIVYWNSIEKIHSSSFQERLFSQIESGRFSNDFSPSDIFQHVEASKREAILFPLKEYDSHKNFLYFKNLLLSAQSQILFFSGNLSFSNLVQNNKKIHDVLQDRAENNVTIKILNRVQVPGIETVKEILGINDRIGKSLIDIRHSFQPLRAVIVDDKVASFKEEFLVSKYKEEELERDYFAIYRIYDEEWIRWIQKVFWNLFRVAVSAEKRIKDIGEMRKI